MDKSITITVPETLALEILAYKNAADVKGLLVKVIEDLVREARVNAAIAAQPAVVPLVEPTGINVVIS